MKHCEKCLYYEKCKAEMDEAPDDIFTFFPYNEDCPHFKNKADFVEVVRCKDCKFCERYSIYDDDYYCMAEHTQSLFSPNKTDYCSYGEKKETMKDAGVRIVLTSGPVRTGRKVKFCVVCGKRISKPFFWKKTCSGFCQSRYKSGYAPYKF